MLERVKLAAVNKRRALTDDEFKMLARDFDDDEFKLDRSSQNPVHLGNATIWRKS